MDEQLYRESLLEIFRNPSNRGEIKDPDLEARLVNPLCGDEIKIQLKLKHTADRLQATAKKKERRAVVRGLNAVVESATFSGNGCAISQVSASLLATYIEGKSLSEVKKLTVSDVIKLIGITPSPARLKCALLGLEVLKEAVKEVI
jgi:nitrogen fixation NifU-like protein